MNNIIDKYQCLKLPITSILYKNFKRKIETERTINILNDTIKRVNSITGKTYFLLRLWILNKYHNNLDIPKITNDTISMCMKSLLIGGHFPKENNLLLFNEFKELQKFYKFEIEDGKNLFLNGKFKKESIHRLVALTYLENPNNYKYVLHIDNNKLNNNVENLKWSNKIDNHKIKKVKEINV